MRTKLPEKEKLLKIEEEVAKLRKRIAMLSNTSMNEVTVDVSILNSRPIYQAVTEAFASQTDDHWLHHDQPGYGTEQNFEWYYTGGWCDASVTIHKPYDR